MASPAPPAVRHIDNAGSAANAERRGRRRDLHIAGLGHLARHEGNRATRDVEQGGIGVAALLIDKFVDDDARIGGEAERRLVVEGNAKRGIRAGLQRIVFKDRVVDFQRDGRAALARLTVALPCRVAT